MKLYTFARDGVIASVENHPYWDGYPPLFPHRNDVLKRLQNMEEQLPYDIAEVELRLPTKMINDYLKMREHEREIEDSYKGRGTIYDNR